MNRLESRALGTGRAGEVGPRGASPPPGRPPVTGRGAPTSRACPGPCPQSPSSPPHHSPRPAGLTWYSACSSTHTPLGTWEKEPEQGSDCPAGPRGGCTASGQRGGMGLGDSSRQTLSPQAGAPSAVLCPPHPAGALPTLGLAPTRPGPPTTRVLGAAPPGHNLALHLEAQ